MEQVKSYPLDHHGIVAGVCDELGLTEAINARIGSTDPRRAIQPGVSVKAMIINGLGFANRSLYLTPHFFMSKPVELLFGKGIEAKDLDDHTLGKTLDEIYNYGCTRLFSEIAFEIAKKQGLLGRHAKLDSTSFSLEGEYKNSQRLPESTEIDGDSEPIVVSYGYSKDKRPDLKQVMLSMMVNGPADIPLWCQGMDGNSSDKKTFGETIVAVETFRKAVLEGGESFIWIADAALYSSESLLTIRDYKWISRVPETLKECKKIIDEECDQSAWVEHGNGYSFREVSSNYGGLQQRWLIVRSKQARVREEKTLMSKIAKEEEEAKKALWHLKNKQFNCRHDAERHLNDIRKSYKFHSINGSLVEVKKHSGRGRPKNGTEAGTVGYAIEGDVLLDEVKKEVALNRKGIFVLATNDLDKSATPSSSILESYKDQQSVERGFRFLKDPYFMADQFFLKKPERIEALMMVMCLMLLVYNFAQYRLREALKSTEETLPNQRRKEIKNPTMRWVFQLMEGVGVVEISGELAGGSVKLAITNLTPLRLKILRLCGPQVMKIYKVAV